MNKRTTESGFTIVEILAAMAVFTIGIVTLVGLASSVQVAQRNNQYLNQANIAARNILEKIRNNESSTLQYGQITKTEADEPTLAKLPQAEAKVDTTNPMGIYGMKNIGVTVTYKVGQVTKTVYLSSLVGNQGLVQ